MELKEYFESAKGVGILATADSKGHVDVAVYSRPHFMEDGSLAFIMRDRDPPKTRIQPPCYLHVHRKRPRVQRQTALHDQSARGAEPWS